MLFRQIIHEDLGCASYLVADREAGSRRWSTRSGTSSPTGGWRGLHGVRIEHVLETHNHADHVSGHGRLARSTGATIHIHELAEAEYPHEPFADGWKLELGDVDDRGDPHPRPPARAHLLPAARRQPRRRPLGAAERRLALHRRRRPARPGGRAARGRRRDVPLPARAAAAPCPTRSRSGPATSAARSAAAPGSTSRPPRRSASSAATTARCGSPTRRSSSRTRSARSATSRRTSSTSSPSTAARWSRTSARRRR